MGKLSSKSKWAWRAHFLSHNPEILENWITFKDVQMLLLSFFEIPNGEKLAKNVQKRYVQVILRSTAEPSRAGHLPNQAEPSWVHY